MSPDIWNAVLPQADAVIWCTPATQAWRQSEAAIWDEIDPDVQERSVLLVTRIDKVLSDSDRARLMKRMRRETTGTFRDIFAVDLMSATKDLEAGRRRRDAGGAGSRRDPAQRLRRRRPRPPRPSRSGRGGRQGPAPAGSRPRPGRGRPAATVIPRRVSSGGLTAMRRPRRTTGTGGSAV
jgi:hypothetical protein